MKMKKVFENYRKHFEEKNIEMPDMQYGSSPEVGENSSMEEKVARAEEIFANLLQTYKDQMDLGAKVLKVMQTTAKEVAHRDEKGGKTSRRTLPDVTRSQQASFEAKGTFSSELAKKAGSEGIPKYDRPENERGWKNRFDDNPKAGKKIVRTDVGDYDLPDDYKKTMANPDDPAARKYIVHNMRTAAHDEDWNAERARVDDKEKKGKKLTKKDKAVGKIRPKFGVPFEHEELIDFTMMFEGQKDWYKDFEPIFKDLLGPLYREFFVALGITSQSTAVLDNFDRACEQMMYFLENGHYRIGGDNAKNRGMYDANFKKANAAIDSGVFHNETTWIYPLGDKIGNYTANILGDTEAVTIDLWMIRFLLGDASGNISDARKKLLQDEVREVARALGWEPRQVQAAIWMGAKANWPEAIGGSGGREVTDYIAAMNLRSDKLQEIIDAIRKKG